MINEFGEEKICLNGITGYRGPAKGDAKYWHHMSAIKIQQMHPDLFQSYRKISIIRNPYQKAISLFLWLGPITNAHAQELAATSPSSLKSIFLLFLQFQHNISDLLTDSSRLLIDGNLVIDHILRYENLDADLSELIQQLRLPLTIEKLKHFKSSGRSSQGHDIHQYFSNEALQAVNIYFDWYFDLFNYSKYEDISDLITSSNNTTRSSSP